MKTSLTICRSKSLTGVGFWLTVFCVTLFCGSGCADLQPPRTGQPLITVNSQPAGASVLASYPGTKFGTQYVGVTPYNGNLNPRGASAASLPDSVTLLVYKRGFEPFEAKRHLGGAPIILDARLKPSAAPLSRDVLQLILPGLTIAQVVELLGLPDSSHDTGETFLYYRNASVDPISHKIDPQMQIIVSYGSVNSVNFH